MTLPVYRVDWLEADASSSVEARTFAVRYPVRLADGCQLSLPLTPLPGGELGIALLMSNQTSFTVERKLVERLTTLVRRVHPEAVVGVPTLGLAYARSIAEAIGLPDYVALGHSRKFWYDETLSESAVSVTSPEQAKRLYLDPALLERVQGKRVAVVDDVLNTGGTMAAALRLLRKAGAQVIAITAVLTEGWDWYRALASIDPATPDLVQALGHIPLFARTATGWTPVPDTELGARPIL